MSTNYLLKYSEDLATGLEELCKSLNDRRGNSNTLFQLKKSSSSVFANISEAQYPQSLPDMLSKFEIARKGVWNQSHGDCMASRVSVYILYKDFFGSPFLFCKKILDK
ncbi:MAG: four helix bundle protein [Clostridia bacterium]|nr:four helix bundle protein [Clostridia bacterium]